MFLQIKKKTADANKKDVAANKKMLQIRRDVAATKNVAAIPNLYTGTQSYSFLGERHVLVSLWEGNKRRIAV